MTRRASPSRSRATGAPGGSTRTGAVTTASEVARLGAPRRVAMLSVHTSPLDQPGTGDAGGLNVYVVEVARRLAELGTEVEVFTRATSSEQPPVVELAPGVLVRHVPAGPYEVLTKEDVAVQLCALTSGVLRVEAAHEAGRYDLVHGHYWLSGQVGWLCKERWGVPLVQSMHTLALVKNAALPPGDTPEPPSRVSGELQVVEQADRLVANTVDEARALVTSYGAAADQVAVVHPGVDLDLFSPGDRAAARGRLGVPPDADVLLFVGRIQQLKAPDVLLEAAAQMVAADPARRERRRPLVVAVVGGTSGGSRTTSDALVRLADGLGIADLVRFVPPVDRSTLADWFRAASLTVVPSHSESFGLVAIESQAAGTPVVAAAVGGLHTAVDHRRTGMLLAGRDPVAYATTISALLDAPGRLAAMGVAARTHAERFGWGATAAQTREVYAEAAAASRRAAADRMAVS